VSPANFATKSSSSFVVFEDPFFPESMTCRKFFLAGTAPTSPDDKLEDEDDSKKSPRNSSI
jgi:hypothetical protein